MPYFFVVVNSRVRRCLCFSMVSQFYTAPSYNLDGSVRHSGSKSNFFEPLSPGTASKLEADFVCNF